MSGFTLIKVEKKFQPGTTTAWGTQVTVLQNGMPVDYFFDTTGAPMTRPAGPRGEVITRLTAAQLPASISSYLNQTYAGYQLVVAESMRSTSGVEEFRVQIVSNNQRIDVHFDGSGAFRDAHTAPGNLSTVHSVSYIPRDSLSDAIKTVLTSTFANYTYGWAEQHIHDGTPLYDVKLFSSTGPFVIHFDAAGAQVAPMGPGGQTTPGSTTAVTGPGPKPGNPSPPSPGSATPPAGANYQFMLDATKLPSAITAYLETNFSGYTFLVADLHTPPTGTTGQYNVDLAVGSQLYKLRFSSSGELLKAEARG
ncbi:hypothetical protein [Larkinella insperata]|uniref:hypothetical protein n=1 Tax=Larkinella insperata TaxID=332158 RepID=UPI0036D339CB